MPAWSQLEGSGGTAARPEVVHPSVSHGVLAVDIPFSSKEDTNPFSGEEDTRVEPTAVLLSQELVMIRSSYDTAMVVSSSRSGVTHELVWPCPSELGKARFTLHDEEEVKL